MNLYALIVQETSEGAPPEQAPAGPSFFLQMLPFIAIFVLFYFLLIRPQRRQQKEREALLGQIKKNDHVLTSGGIYGIVDKVKDTDVILKIDEKNDVRIRVARSAVVSIEKASGAAVDEEKKAEAPEQSGRK